jgi:hypothetical protein
MKLDIDRKKRDYLCLRFRVIGGIWVASCTDIWLPVALLM